MAKPIGEFLRQVEELDAEVWRMISRASKLKAAVEKERARRLAEYVKSCK